MGIYRYAAIDAIDKKSWNPSCLANKTIWKSPKGLHLVTFIQLLVHLDGREKAICYFYHLVLGGVPQPNSAPSSPIHAPGGELHCGQVCVQEPHVQCILLHMLVFCLCFFWGKVMERKACIGYFLMSSSMIDALYILVERKSKSTPKLLKVFLSSKGEVVTYILSVGH